MDRVFQIDAEIDALVQAHVDPETGELSDEVLEAIDALELEREKKLLDVARIVEQEKLEAEAVGSVIKRLERRKAIHERHAEKLKAFLGARLRKPVESDGKRKVPGEKLQAADVRVAWRKSDRLEIESEDDVPLEFQDWKMTVKKAELKKAIKEGRYTGSAATVKVYFNLQVK